MNIDNDKEKNAWKLINAPNPPTPPPPACGVRKPLRINGRMFNAQNVLDACRWPWIVSIRVRQNSFASPTPSNTDSLCTGVLVKEDTVLTSANCLHMASVLNNRQRAAPNLLVVAGDLNTKTLDISNPTPRERYHTVCNTSIHPGNYRPDETRATLNDIAGENDIARKSFNIAVLKLNERVELGDCREKACLPSFLDLATKDNGVKNCFMASYGTYDSTQNPSENLKESQVVLYPSYTCDLVSYPFTSAPGTTCGRFTEGRPSGLCQGDDGGMVICEDAKTSTWKLFGLIDYAKFKKYLKSHVQVFLDWD
ncbi:hypothetical protein LOTGIDRAFT_155299 [Lottia gigantea]|uniref:Peptidase S1 domain-containing protein n=1 Tax=Lottia gigantea TaxID=225164 RepID=V4B667_LOTGI|nr:hypothetical protein LOTGIDRAFT_155299 [Lottia gigantea]ESO83989.1 hypothetical protein LOTGIDRAFT_155299 [Lottia gigantea]